MTATDGVDLVTLRQHGWRLSPDKLAEHLSEGEWEAVPHLRYVARKVRECVLRRDGRLIVEMPPRHGKSLLVSKWTPVWLLQLDPSQRILLASYDADYAAEWGREVRNVLEDNAEELGVEVASDSTAARRWHTTESEGGMVCGGPGSGFTGRGGDLLVIDDPVKNYADAHSAVKRQAWWDLYTSTLRSRLQPGGSVILVMTRWHEDDLSGRLQDPGRVEGRGADWEVVSLPAIAEHGEEWEVGDDRYGSREEDDALWPEMWPAEDLALTKLDQGSYLWAGMYQQRPAPAEGGVVKRGWWKYWRELPARFDERLITMDCTFKGHDETDFVVMQAWARKGADRYLLDQVRGRMDFPETQTSFLAFCKRHPHHRKRLVEDKANGPAIIASLRSKIPGLIPWPRKGERMDSKEARVAAVSPEIEAGNVWIPDPEVAVEGLVTEAGTRLGAFDVAEFVEEWAEFPNGRHDDQVDGGSMALLEMGARAPRRRRLRSATAAGRPGAVAPPPSG